MPNEFALEDRVTKLEQNEKNRNQDSAYIVVEQTFGMTDELNRVNTYGPFLNKEDAQKFVAEFSYGRATRGLTVSALRSPR